MAKLIKKGSQYFAGHGPDGPTWSEQVDYAHRYLDTDPKVEQLAASLDADIEVDQNLPKEEQ